MWLNWRDQTSCICCLCVTCLCMQNTWAKPKAPNDLGVKEKQAAASSTHQNKQSLNTAKALSLPKLIQSKNAIYPIKALSQGKEAQVDLLVTILSDGSVDEIVVEQSSDPCFNESAVTAVKQWQFKPAHQGETAIDSRIRIPFVFTIPKAKPKTVVRELDDQPGSPVSALKQPANQKIKPNSVRDTRAKEDVDSDPILMTVRGHNDRYLLQKSSSDFFIGKDVMTAAPHQEGAEVLRTAPGLYIGRAEGPAIAHNYMLRGFDSEHGQDIAFHVGGIPINLPSHIHGQGYSDLGFLIGDVVHGLEVTEGVHKAQQGDFAVAGSIDVSLGVDEADRGVQISMSKGTWNTSKYKVVWAPKGSDKESFGAFEVSSSDGFGENRTGTNANGIFQHRFGQGKVKHRVLAVLHSARANFAGVLRYDDVNSGKVCFTCVYPYATAKAQNALANRIMLGYFTDYKGSDGERGEVGIWLSYDNFRIQSNYTGFQETSRTLEREAGRGDLIEQQNYTQSVGIKSRYRKSVIKKSWLKVSAEFGADGRMDMIDQTQSLLDAAVRNQTWDQRVDASIKAVDLGGWGDLKWYFNRYATLHTGMRVDALSYEINDRLGNFVPLTRPQDSFITGFRRSALGLAWGPRSSLELKPLSWWSIFVSYGEGYRSPQARLLEDGEKAPFSKVKSADLGTRFDLGSALRLVLGGYHTELSDDVAFEASEGRLERIGATQRRGLFAHIHSQPFSWLLGSLSATFVDAELLAPPPASAEEPFPPFKKGQQLPFVPPLVIRADIGTQHVLIDRLGQSALKSRFGLGFSYLSPRPLPYNEFADPVSLLDISAGLEWGILDLTFELFNALNNQYAALEYSFPSDWDPNNGLRSRTPMRHRAAGAPLSWMLSLGVKL
ncbi:MAG: hypothetical protein CMH49_06965 [Myxococcales bacterium]|nr:hypothetical protein [Myxococcales bacterium]